MSPLDAWRRELRALIPRGFLRRDQGRGLLVSDYPRHGGETETTKALMRAGYTVRMENRMAFVDGSLPKYQALAAALSDKKPCPTDENLILYALGGLLLRSSGRVTEENLPLVRLTLKYLDSNDLTRLARELSPACAEAQRKHIGLPKAAGLLILYALRERSDSPC